jgi:hypothetical protein
VAARGWHYEVASEPPVIELANIRFLAGYRRRHLVDDALVRRARAAGIDGATLAEAVTQVGGPAPQARATILHLMWTQELIVDTTQPLTSEKAPTRTLGAPHWYGGGPRDRVWRTDRSRHALQL